MTGETFQALVVDLVEGQSQASLQQLSTDALPPGDLEIAVEYSSLNYKDGLAVTGQGKILRSFPLVPGIDLAGVVTKSDTERFHPGDRVLVTGWGIGERYWGGYTQRTRVRSEWALPVPEPLTTRQAMGLGTAGLTAMLCLMELERRGLRPGEREVVVTGAAGGVGSVAVALLANRGHKVVASTGRVEMHPYLHALGAQEIVDRQTLATPSEKPLESERWGGAIDTVGGDTLAGLLRAMAYRTSVAACGLAGGSALQTTVFPFILRAVSLIGVDSNQCPQEQRREAWARLAREMPLDRLVAISTVVPLRDVPALSREILQGRTHGRNVIDLRAP